MGTAAHSPPNGLFNVRDFGATGTGSHNDRPAFLAADAAALPVKGAIYVPLGDYMLASSTTLESPIVFVAGAELLPAVRTTLVVNGRIVFDAPLRIFGGAGAVRLGKENNAEIWADWFSGVDIGARINAAIAAVAKGPATIKIGAASSAFATGIDATDTHGIRLTSESGDLNSVTDWGPNLIWTGGAKSGPALKAPGAMAFELDHLNISYSHPAYNGNLVSLSSVGGAMNTTEPHIHHCRIAGTPNARFAARLIELQTTLGVTIEHVTLDYAVDGIGCSGGSNNTVVIGNGVWIDKHFSGKAIRAWGNNWKIGPLVGESDPRPGIPLTPFFGLAGEVTAVHFDTAEVIDGGNGGGTLIDLTGFKASGIRVSGGSYGAASGTFLRCSSKAGETSGLSVNGVVVLGMSVGIHLGSANGASIKGNQLHCTTPWTGTAPTQYEIGNNDLGDSTTSGVPVPKDSDIAITPPGSASDGLGEVLITVREDNASARYFLNGAAGTTAEVSDPGNVFSPTFNTERSLNIYWDRTKLSYRLQNKRGDLRTVIVTSVVGI